MDKYHIPVLLRETILGLNIKLNGKYIDGTIGGGGHASEILKKGGIVLGIDQDQDAILHIKKKFESEIEMGRLIVARGNFGEMEMIAKENNFSDVDGILLDLGVSSHQIDADRGFSFMRDEKLDMRMNQNQKLSAADVVNTWTEEDLYEIFAKYGEEVRSREFAQAIVSKRKEDEIKTTAQLAEIIGAKNFVSLSRIFQAIRIAVNDEMGSLKSGLASGFKLLKSGGRMEVISFHSLEDRVVKLFATDLERENNAKVITKKPIVATEDEIRVNKRSRSAKLRIIEKI